MISMSYACKCGWESYVLSDAQDHADKEQHSVAIRGFISPRVDPRSATTAEVVKKKAFDQAVLRAAKERGLLK